MNTSATGPIPPEEFRALIEAPYGAATKAIRQYDPMWGRKDGETVRWRVRVSMERPVVGSVIVEAETEEEAIDRAFEVNPDTIEWEPDGMANLMVESAEPLP